MYPLLGYGHDGYGHGYGHAGYASHHHGGITLTCFHLGCNSKTNLPSIL